MIDLILNAKSTSKMPQIRSSPSLIAKSTLRIVISFDSSVLNDLAVEKAFASRDFRESEQINV